MITKQDTIWEVASSGYSVNGGGFSTSTSGSTGIDYSLRITPYKSFGTLSCAGGTTITCSAPDSFDDTVRGNAIYISGQLRSIITSYNSSTSVSVDVSYGSFSNLSGCIGGALKSLTDISSDITYGNIVYYRSGIYTPTGGAMSLLQYCCLVGYGTVRGDDGLAYIDGSSMSFSNNILNINDRTVLKNIYFANAKSNAVNGSNQNVSVTNCAAVNSVSNGFSAINVCSNCFASGNGGGGFQGYFVANSVAVANGTYGFGNTVCVNCIAYNNSRASNNSYHGFDMYSQGCFIISCISDGAGQQRDGFSIPLKSLCINSIAINNVRYGFNYTEYGGFSHNAAYGNGTANYNNYSVFADHNVTLTAGPLTNSSILDFSLNGVAGGGNMIKNSGLWGAIPYTQTLSYGDIGPVQSQASGSSGGGSTVSYLYNMIPNFNGGIL